MNMLKRQKPSEPNQEEASNSKYYMQAIESFKAFQQSNNSNDEQVSYDNFIKDFYTFLLNENNTIFIKYYSASMLQEAMKFSSKSNFNKENIILIFNILTKIVSITINVNTTDFSAFIFSLMANNESIEILNSNVKTLEAIFSNEEFFTEFVEQQRVPEFFEISFINFKSVKLCSLFRHLICEISPQSQLSNINLTKIISFLLTSVRSEIQIEYSIVLSKLIANSPRNRLFLNNAQSFEIFSNFIQSASSNIIIDCFNSLVFTMPIDLEILSNFILFYQKYPQHQNSLFHWIFDDVIQNHTDMLYEIDEIIPFSTWVTYSTTVSDVIKAILTLSKIDINFTSPFISPLFSLLNKGDSNFVDYRSSIQIIENQILLHQTSLNSLANSLFLETFVINIKIDLLGQLFEKLYTFAQLVYDIYTLPQSESLRASIINKLIQMAGKFPSNAQFISIFLVVSNSKKNISDLMSTIIENKNGDLCVALGDSFVKSESVVHYFINGNGIGWLDEVYKMKIINFKQFVFLINSLTKNYFIKEVDNYINSLPKNHPLFSLSQEELFTLCYGYEGAHHYYPLKILSLFPLLNDFQKVDPYNAYMIGKHALDKCDNMENLPLFSDVVNRYVSDETFKKIIKLDASKFDNFVNPYYDHFPLFQIYEFLDENSFDVKFKAISFWFKFSQTIRNELKIPFFHADKLQLFLKDSKLIANYEGVEYDAQVNPVKWNNVIVVVSGQKVSHYVEVYVNLNKAVFISSRLFNEMPNFEFSTYSAFLFVGPAIRIYQNEMIDDEIDKIYKNGPSFLGHLNESLVITPSSKEYLTLGRNVFAVKYRGFPVHFLSKNKLNFLFNRMINSEKNDFYLLATSCFKIFSMLRNSLRDFFRSILTVYSKVPKFITLKLLMNTLDFFFKYYPKSEIIDTIIGHKNFWSNVPKDIIINAIVLKCKDFDFYKEKEKFETFLSIESYYSFENPKLFETLFHYSKNCQSIIHELFTGSHFISEKQNKLFLESKNDDVDNSSEIIENSNTSIQSNILNSIQNNSPNSDSVLTFQKINPVPFQKAFADMLNKLLLTETNVNFVPFDGVYGLFLTTDTKMKAVLYPVLLNCEKINPNSIQFDSSDFLMNVPQLFKYDEVWIETFNLLTMYSKEIMKPSVLPALFALFWGATVASFHSVASTGETILNDNEEINKIINFLSLENNLKIISNDKNTLKFIISWFPFILCNSPPVANDSLNDGYESQSFKLNGNTINSPSSFSFVSMIWNEVIKESGLPVQTNKEHYKKIQSFLVHSNIFNFYFKLMFSLSDSHFNEFLGSFLSAPFVSPNKELAKCYACDFIHSMLNIVAESYSLTMNIDLIFPFIHSMCFFDFITNQYLTKILSDLFLITSIIFVAYKSSFNKLALCLNFLILNLFLYSLKICKNNEDDSGKMIDVLYQVLFQQIHFLSKIALESQKEIDLYLLFFKQSYQFCSKKEIFNKVVSQFVNDLNLSENSIISDYIELDLTQWDNFVKNISIPNEMKHLSFNNIKECSKSFTFSFLNALDKQIQISESLSDLFTMAKTFRDSKVDWTKTLHDIYQNFNDSFISDSKLIISENDENQQKSDRKKILAPFIFPLRIPRLFYILPEFANDFNDDENSIKFINEMNLYKKPLENLDNLIHKIKTNSDNNHDFDEKTDILQCELKRLSESIPSIIITLHKEILILPFCKLNHSNPKSMSDLNPPLKSTDVSRFVKEVVIGMWGNSILYNDRILIRVSLDSILLAEQTEKKSIAVWSISSGHFLIEKFTGDVIKFITKLKKRKNFPFSSSLKIPTLEKFIIAWKNSAISSSQFLLGINLFNCRTFSDDKKFPLFPSKSTVFGSKSPISDTTLANLTKPTIENDSFEFSNTIEESQEAVTQFITDEFMLSININDRKVPIPLFEGALSYLSQKLNTEELSEGKIFDFNYNSKSNRLIFNLPKLSVRISDEKEMIFLIIDKGRLTLSMHDFDRNETICEEKSSLLASAKNLYVSENRLFFSIDFNTNITCIYQIVYSNWSPIAFKFIRDISFGMKQSTCISGVDWLGATSVNDKIVMWHFFPNTIHRIVQFNSKIEFVKFDENSGFIWVVSNRKEKSSEFVCEYNFTLLSVNGEIFAKKSLQFECDRNVEISSFSVVPQPISVNVREAVCGFTNGFVYFLSVVAPKTDVNIVKLNSLHHLPVKRFVFHPCTTFFVSVDSGNNAFVWTQKKEEIGDSENHQFLDISALESCPSCGSDEISIYCKSCGRVFCKKCLDLGSKCKDCLEK